MRVCSAADPGVDQTEEPALEGEELVTLEGREPNGDVPSLSPRVQLAALEGER